MPVFLFVIFGVLVLAFIIYGWYASEKRRKELLAWAHARELTFSPHKVYNLDNRFPDFDCLKKGSNRYGCNTLNGQWRGREFLGFDYHYETESRDSKGHRSTTHHHFSAVVLASDVPLKPLFVRPEGFFDKVTEFFGYDDIDFESAEFSRKFYVKAPDRRWAYDVIHARTMEFLLGEPRFTLKFDPGHVIAYRSSRFKAQEFEAAAEVIRGILDRLPDYLVRQQRTAHEAGLEGYGSA